MTQALIRVLLVDDDADDYAIVKDLLAEISVSSHSLSWVSTFATAIDAICSNEHDVYLIDYNLGAQTGVDLIREAIRRKCGGPIILLTGQSAREFDLAAMEAGAADYLEKAGLDAAALERAIRYAMLKWRHENELERLIHERTADLERANATLAEADRRKTEFIATLAHELRNPLAPLRNAVEIMRRASHDPIALERSRNMIERQVQHLIRLVDDLLDISRISRGKVELRKSNVPLADVVQDAVECSRPFIEAGQHQLQVNLPKTPAVIHVDGTRLCQILLNLLNNAAKYTDAGGEITLTAEAGPEHVVFRVRDSGIGIPPEMLARVFESFTQASNCQERAQGGLGIGLALVKSLVELHGGSVAAHSAGAGLGSEFIVYLPLQGGAA